MAVTVKQEVAALYSAIFNRAPDQAGLEFWVNAIEGGDSLVQAAEGFTQHPVFAETYAGMSDSQFVQQLYVNILGGAGDANGIAFWTEKLASGVSKGQVVAEFVQGALSIDLDALLASGELSQAEYDAAVLRQDSLTNKANVGLHFVEKFGAATNLSADTDTTTKEGLESDPVYLASQAAIANVTADAASVTAANAAINAAGAPTDLNVAPAFTLTEALDTYLDAQEARAEFLKNALENELVAEEAADDAETAEAGDLEAALGASVAGVDTAIDAVFESDSAFGEADTSTNVREALITDALEAAQKDIDDAQDSLDAAQRAFQAEASPQEKRLAANYEAAAANFEAAKAERDSAQVAAEAALKDFKATFDAAQDDDKPKVDLSNKTVIALDNGTKLAEFQTIEGGEGAGRFVILSNGLNVEGLESVVDTINDALVASDAVNDARAERDAAREDLGITVTNDGSGNITVTTDGNEDTGASAKAAALYNQVIGATEALAAEEAELDALEAAIDDYRELVDLNQQYDDLDEAVTEARLALTNTEDDDPAGLGINLRESGENATFNDDLFIFSEDFNGKTIVNFGKAGEDKIYFGSGFELVALGDNEITDRVGASDQLEIFWEDTSAGLVLYVEAEAEAGRDTGAAAVENITTITLAGVSGEDVSLEGGFLTVA